MTGRARALLDQLLDLPPDELREVVEGLERAGLLDPDEDPEWVAEIERRIESVVSGQAATIPWTEARKRLQEDRATRQARQGG